jgi:siderophore synthetase component
MPLPLETPGRPEERVLRQFTAALLFERLVEWRASPAEQGLAEFGWTAGDRAFRCRGAVGPFGRLRLMPGSVEMMGSGGWGAARLAAVIEGVEGAPERKETLLREMEQTIAFMRLNAAEIERGSRRDMPFDALEGALDEGHPYHPCFKARSGFSDADHRAYGPEAGNAFQLLWLLVSRRHLRQALPSADDSFWIAELGEETWAELSRRRERLGLDQRKFGLLPLHPWQWERLRESALAPWLEKAEAFCLGEAGDVYRASQSVRTLINADHPRRAHLKLALNMVHTSALRILEPHSVCTAPALSNWLAGVVADDALFEERYPLAILREYAGIIAGFETPLAGQLAAIWRESPHAALSDGEAAVPFNALMMVETDGRPFVEHWVGHYGLSAWLDRLIDVAVLPVWHLLVCHGIGTEAHGQNMLLAHRGGWPTRLILRDFHESVEFMPAFLRDPARAPDFPALDPAYRNVEPDEFYWTETLEPMRELVMDTLFIYNLTEVSLLLERFYALPEAAFWKKVENRLAAYAAEHGFSERQAMLGHTSREILTESLLARKLFASRRELHHRVPNVFGAHGG